MKMFRAEEIMCKVEMVGMDGWGLRGKKLVWRESPGPICEISDYPC